MRTLKIPGIEALEFGIRLSRAFDEFAEGKRQVSSGAAVSYRDVLLRAQLDESFDGETRDGSIPRMTARWRPWPAVELVKVADDKGLTDLQVFGQPFGERDGVAVAATLALDVKNAESRKVDKGSA